ncbi:MAG: hypothetical protein PHV63_00180 [Candidatus Daviesbacteria bacterium]|nr:hypothetical protein [Candidatus Daviesbacteria bacterium]
MAQEIKEHLIPPMDTLVSPDTGKEWTQTNAIPVEIREITSPTHILNAKFCSPNIRLVVGGEDLDTALQRMRILMICYLEIGLNQLEEPNPPLNAASMVEQISRYFVRKPNARPGL